MVRVITKVHDLLGQPSYCFLTMFIIKVIWIYIVVSYPLEAFCGMIVTLLDSSVSLFLFLLIGYLCLFLPHGLTNVYIISIFIF